MTITTALIAFCGMTIFALALEIMYTYATQGFGFGFSSNRPMIERSPLALRIQRAYQNQVESAAYILPAFVAAALAGLSGPLVEFAALAIIAGRFAFLILYYSGVPFLRLLGFIAGTMGSLFLCYLAVTALVV